MTNNILSAAELVRYQRQILMSEIGTQGQLQLKSAKILVVGCGGLAATLIPYLSASGVGNITIIDGDKVELSNLQRQIIFSEKDVGDYKVDCMARFCQQQNAAVTINPITDYLQQQMLTINLQDYNLIVDATDDLWVRYYLNDRCVALNIPFSFASVQAFKGHCGLLPGRQGPCYRCVFPNPPDLNQIPTCQQAGIFAPVPGLFGILQATEILQWLLDLNIEKKPRWFEINCQTFAMTTITLTNDPSCACCQQKQPALAYPINSKIPVAEIEFRTFRATIIAKNIPYLLLDVRTRSEHAVENIGGNCLPLVELVANVEQLPRDKLIIIYCQSGQRSKMACQQLQQLGFANIYSLKREL